MQLDELIAARRSVRKYKDQPVSREDLERILEAGRLAPSARNDQNWTFTAVLNPALREKLCAACAGQAMVRQAPVVLVAWSPLVRVMQCGQQTSSLDCSIALTHMMLKATELGLGSCWLGMFDAKEVKALLGLPAGADVVAVMPIGYADETPKAKPRKPLSEVTDIRF